MRPRNILLALAGTLLACCDAASFAQTKLSKAATLDPIQSSNTVHNDLAENRFLRTSQTIYDETDSTGDEEERGILDVAKKLKFNVRAKLIRDKDIQSNLKTFKDWYRSGKTPETVWNDLQLKPVAKHYYNQFGGIGKLKADTDYQLYLKYEKFYKIMKGTYGKKS
ncbi:hypothetical protein PHYBOEH_006919 [Phytophthora boehmeriae]|uniref:RxLR effector protein n=1 Tax=Phytophthora boehmeriae TaxID=109152 RepID=A0A8T1WBZ1_9STRA|nr:hypothetical protein PHYBOEH_006919 [Phytophthora boehmeriae]